MKDSTVKDIGVALLILAVLIPFATGVGNIYEDPSDPGFGSRDFPKLIIFIGIFLSVILLIRSSIDIVRSGQLPKLAISSHYQITGPLTVLIAALLYVWGIVLFQYALPTLALMFFLVRYFGSRGFFRTILIPLIAVIIYFLVFFVIFGIFEEPGTILNYDSYSVARAIRKVIGME